MTFMPVDVLIDQKAKQRHRIDSLNLLAYVSLLVLVLVTTWFFKRRANKSPIHETGLAIIYGLFMGAALRYFGLEVTISSIKLEDVLPRAAPADYVTIATHQVGEKNQSHLYAYEFRGEIKQSAKLGSQISYASVDPEVFFNIILPPIVLNAGLSLKRRHFFRNIGAIFSYAFIGTTISVATVGSLLYGFTRIMEHVFAQSYLAERFTLANCLYFGAIISPTDPLAVLAIFQELGVDVNLFAVIYGHDPYYSIWRILWQCLYNFLQMFLASCAIGTILGIITAITTKFTKLTESPLLESSLVVLMSYCSFLTAEVLDHSGIVAILMCGITQAHYTINNLSFEARERLKTLFEMLTFLCESFLFLAVGVSFWQRGQSWSPSFIGMAFVAIFLARALSVYPLSFLLNLGRRHKIPRNYQHLITWGGAARGVISYSLAARNTVGDARRIMLSTTSVIVIVTVVSVGAAVGPLLRCLKIPYGKFADGSKLHGHDANQATNGRLVVVANCPASGLQLGGHEEEEQAERAGRGADDDDEEHGQIYHATNNPAWLVRPKRLQQPYRWPACGRYHHRVSNESFLIVGGDSLLSTTPNARRRMAQYCSPEQRCSQSTGCGLALPANAATPVLEIETVPVQRDESIGALEVRQCSCCDCRRCMIDPRGAATPSVYITPSCDRRHFHQVGAHQAIVPSSLFGANTALTQRPPSPQHSLVGQEGEAEHSEAQVADAMNAINYRTSSSLNLTYGNNLQVANANTSMTTTNRRTEGSTLSSVGNRDLGPYENASLVRRWRDIDNYFIKPLLTNSYPTLLDTMPASLRTFAKLFTSDEQLMRHQS